MSARTAYCTTIQQSHDEYAPPDQPVLQVSVVGDDAFLSVCVVEETNTVTTFNTLQTVRVPLRALARALDSDVFWWPKSAPALPGETKP